MNIEAAKRPCLTNKPKRRRKPKPLPDDALGALNQRQCKFVAEYLSNGGNATRAAAAAGYSPSKSYFSAAVQASALLKNPKIRAALVAHYRVFDMTAQEVIARLVEQARANPEHYGDKRRNFVGEHFWVRGYWVSTVGPDEAAVRLYIQH